MNILELKQRPTILDNPKLSEVYSKLGNLLKELEKKVLSPTTVGEINDRIVELNAVSDSGSELKKAISKTQSAIVKVLEKEHKIVPKGYYRNIWMALGMAAFGIPLGVAFGMSIGNMGMIGIGIPIGLAIGVGVGMGMDKKAFEEGRQLEFEG